MKLITKILKKVLKGLFEAKFAILALAAQLAVLSLAFPAAIHLGGNLMLSSLITAVVLEISLLAGGVLTLEAFDYLKEGEYKFTLGSLSTLEKLIIFLGTMTLASLGLQGFAMAVPSIVSTSNFISSFLATTFAFLFSFGVERAEQMLFASEGDDESESCRKRQGKRKSFK